MIKRVLIVTFIFIILALFVFWIVTGGIGAAMRAGANFTNPVGLIFGSGTSTGTFIQLPWQPAAPPRGPDISGYADQANTDIQSLQNGGASDTTAAQAATFGNPSPYVGQITIIDNAATESDPEREYIEIQASENNSAPITITGWSLQSAVSGLRAPIPEAAPVFVLGIVNTVGPVYLDPGDSAIITTGMTPVGTSFRENICSGYLGQLQTFTPALSASCPDPSQALPETAENLRTYGGSCLDYLQNLPQCSFPGTTLPSNLSGACRTYIEDTFSYDGCVNLYRNAPSFARNSWRLFLNMRAELWYNTHDVVRLLDTEGRTVDVLTY
jgi:hypothetical protein